MGLLCRSISGSKPSAREQGISTPNTTSNNSSATVGEGRARSADPAEGRARPGPAAATRGGRSRGAARDMGLEVGVASSSSRTGARHLERLGILDRFDCLRTRDDVEQVKPEPGLYLAVLDCLGVTPMRRRDRGFAKRDPIGQAAGLRTVVVPNPSRAGLDLSEADVKLGSLAEVTLPQLLSRLEHRYPNQVRIGSSRGGDAPRVERGHPCGGAAGVSARHSVSGVQNGWAGCLDGGAIEELRPATCAASCAGRHHPRDIAHEPVEDEGRAWRRSSACCAATASTRWSRLSRDTLSVAAALHDAGFQTRRCAQTIDMT